MRKPRSKIRKAFACNKDGSEEFAKMLEEFSCDAEIAAAYQEYLNGRDFSRIDPEERMLAISALLK